MPKNVDFEPFHFAGSANSNKKQNIKVSKNSSF